jgi:hypothetical protein
MISLPASNRSDIARLLNGGALIDIDDFHDLEPDLLTNSPGSKTRTKTGEGRP